MNTRIYRRKSGVLDWTGLEICEGDILGECSEEIKESLARRGEPFNTWLAGVVGSEVKWQEDSGFYIERNNGFKVKFDNPFLVGYQHRVGHELPTTPFKIIGNRYSNAERIKPEENFWKVLEPYMKNHE